LALDESIDVLDTAQLAIFECGVDTDFKFAEEMTALFPLKAAPKSSG
jgi:hypothetical protein